MCKGRIIAQRRFRLKKTEKKKRNKRKNKNREKKKEALL